MGENLEGTSVGDAGCGTGSLAIPLALRVKFSPLLPESGIGLKIPKAQGNKDLLDPKYPAPCSIARQYAAKNRPQDAGDGDDEANQTTNHLNSPPLSNPIQSL